MTLKIAVPTLSGPLFFIIPIYIYMRVCYNENCNEMARTATIDEIESHCTAEQLKGLKKVVDGLKDDKADLIQSHYQGKFK